LKSFAPAPYLYFFSFYTGWYSERASTAAGFMAEVLVFLEVLDEN
jgi:hypothetical protein